MQTAILYIVITLLMSGVLVGFGLPFLARGLGVARWTRGALADGTRLALAAAIAAIGIAPAYDAYQGPLPIWVRLLRGEPVTLVAGPRLDCRHLARPHGARAARRAPPARAYA